MCCTDVPGPALPEPVAAALAAYQRLSVEETYPDEWVGSREEWVHGRAPFLRAVNGAPPVVRSGTASGFAAWIHSQGFATWVRKQVGDQPPGGLVIVRITADGRLGPVLLRPAWLIAGMSLRRHLLLDSAAPAEVCVRIGEDEKVVPAFGADLIPLTVPASGPVIPVQVGDAPAADVALGRVAETGRLRLRAGIPCRWSVVDGNGGAWFPRGVLRKHDVHDRPFFHGDDVVLDVPATRLTVRVGRGLEYRPAVAVVEPTAGEETAVQLAPRRWLDPASSGWFGADLHVHMNYSAADQVCAPHDAARMQRGEGLHYMNLVAANQRTALVYDREALEAWAGRDLSWSDASALARMGVEYRNDLLGHVHATGLNAPPSRYHTGHPGSDEEEDWPPNATVLEEFRALDAVTGYCHPVFQRFADNSPPDLLFTLPHTIECRELVADAALGLVDSLDVASNGDNLGAAVVYRRLLGAGMRLAATAGTDVMLSLPRLHIHSNPPGWARVYALLEADVSVDALADAIRAGRTVATNGPWLELQVDGQGPGARIDVGGVTDPRVRVTASARGPGLRRLRLYTADGLVTERVTDAPTEDDSYPSVTVHVDLTVDEPTYVVAQADGTGHPEVLQATAFAHTSPVHIDVDGRSVARAADARWCLRWLDELEKLGRRHGVFRADVHRKDFLDVLERARRVYRRVLQAAEAASAQP